MVPTRKCRVEIANGNSWSHIGVSGLLYSEWLDTYDSETSVLVAVGDIFVAAISSSATGSYLSECHWGHRVAQFNLKASPLIPRRTMWRRHLWRVSNGPFLGRYSWTSANRKPGAGKYSFKKCYLARYTQSYTST